MAQKFHLGNFTLGNLGGALTLSQLGGATSFNAPTNLSSVITLGSIPGSLGRDTLGCGNFATSSLAPNGLPSLAILGVPEAQLGMATLGVGNPSPYGPDAHLHGQGSEIVTAGAGWSGFVTMSGQASTAILGGLAISGSTSMVGQATVVQYQFQYSRTITIDHTKVSNTDQTDFPMVFRGTYSFLSYPNGTVTSSSGFDIIFTSDPNGMVQLSFERVYWVSATGECEFWIRIPLLSHTGDTTIYIFYGNSGQTVDPQTRTSTWDSNFRAVYHLGSPTAFSGSDSTSNGFNSTATNGSIQSFSGKLGGCIFSTGGNLALPTTILSGRVLTLSCWVAPPTSTGTMDLMSAGNGGPDLRLNNMFPEAVQPGVVIIGTASTAILSGKWIHLVWTFDNSGNWKLYTNGVQSGSGTHLVTFSSFAFTLGSGITGRIDEARFSNFVRSADWISTEYANQNNPHTFYAVGTESGGSVSSYAYYRAITIDHTKVSTADQTNFPVLVYGTYSSLATVANGGRVLNANGYDIIFSSTLDGTAPIPFERVSWNSTTGAVEFWVNVAALSHTVDTVIYLVYANAAIVDDTQSKNDVWPGFTAVYHMGGTSLDVTDSSPYGANATNHSTTGIAGMIGEGASFPSGSTFIVTGAQLNPVSFSVYGWFKPTSVAGIQAMFEDLAGGGFEFRINSGLQTVKQTVVNWVSTASALTAGVWNQVAFTYDGTNYAFYINGASVGSGTSTTNFPAPTLAQLSGTFESYVGGMDEIHYYTGALSASWIATEYANQNSPVTFYSLGTEQSITSIIVGLGGIGSGSIAGSGGFVSSSSMAGQASVLATGTLTPGGAIVFMAGVASGSFVATIGYVDGAWVMAGAGAASFSPSIDYVDAAVTMAGAGASTIIPTGPEYAVFAANGLGASSFTATIGFADVACTLAGQGSSSHVGSVGYVDAVITMAGLGSSLSYGSSPLEGSVQMSGLGSTAWTPNIGYDDAVFSMSGLGAVFIVPSGPEYATTTMSGAGSSTFNATIGYVDAVVSMEGAGSFTPTPSIGYADAAFHMDGSGSSSTYGSSPLEGLFQMDGVGSVSWVPNIGYDDATFSMDGIGSVAWIPTGPEYASATLSGLGTSSFAATIGYADVAFVLAGQGSSVYAPTIGYADGAGSATGQGSSLFVATIGYADAVVSMAGQGSSSTYGSSPIWVDPFTMGGTSSEFVVANYAIQVSCFANGTCSSSTYGGSTNWAQSSSAGFGASSFVAIGPVYSDFSASGQSSMSVVASFGTAGSTSMRGGGLVSFVASGPIFGTLFCAGVGAMSSIPTGPDYATFSASGISQVSIVPSFSVGSASCQFDGSTSTFIAAIGPVYADFSAAGLGSVLIFAGSTAYANMESFASGSCSVTGTGPEHGSAQMDGIGSVSIVGSGPVYADFQGDGSVNVVIAAIGPVTGDCEMDGQGSATFTAASLIDLVGQLTCNGFGGLLVNPVFEADSINEFTGSGVVPPFTKGGNVVF